MTVDRETLKLASASLFAPVLAAAIGAALLACFITPEMIFAVETGSEYSGQTRAATFPEVVKSLVGFASFGMMLGAMVGWPAMALVGLPAHKALVGHGRTGLGAYALAALLAGTLAMLAYFILTSLRAPFAVLGAGPLLWSGPLAGVLTGILFWLIRRPDRMDPAG